MQNYFASIANPILHNLNATIDLCRQASMPVIFTRHSHQNGHDHSMLAEWWFGDLIVDGTPDAQLIAGLHRNKLDLVVEKNTYSAFRNTDLEDKLVEMGIEEVIVTGVTTNLCCETNAREAFVRGFRVFFSTDGTATFDLELHEATLKNMAYGYRPGMGGLDFKALKKLQNSANELLHSAVVQESLVEDGEEKWLNEFCDSCLRMLEVCGISKDVVVLVKEHVQDVRFTLRRASIGEAGIQDKMAACDSYRKKLKKEILKCLKWFKAKTITNNPNMLMKEHKLMLVVDVLREVRLTSISIVESLLSLISTPWLDLDSKSKSSSSSSSWRRSLFPSKVVVVPWDDDDAMLLHSANKRLAGVQMAIEDLELELECMFRRLIHTRVLLLNILTAN
ncbi:hypothetical protein PIB30_017894 [Stylosanthes scabra]|uniref:Isochorismatase-like domain-containing protein n=1 Tax=Stylosanthes scabra TaxID=79078 RepID=A0ABU6Z6R5_9FABA|nr:hypothetical protein [Stylosanthes scabra]